MSTARSDLRALPGLAWPVEMRRHPRARRLRLRLDEPRAVLRLTLPPRSSERAALEWVIGQAAWVDAQIRRIDPPIRLLPGERIPFDGAHLHLVHDPAAPRSPRLTAGELRCGGPVDAFAGRILRWLRAQARLRLIAETEALALRHGVAGGPVSVGDASTRWGSCSASGAIRYSWRLILAPPDVRAFVVAHEVAHRVHLNHGVAFHRLEAQLYDGDVVAARSELRRIGGGLKRIGGR